MNHRDTYLLTGEAEPVSVGGRTMTIQGTGTSNESLNAFIYAPSSTVISAGVAKSWNNSGRYQWVQQHGAKHTHSVIQKRWLPTFSRTKQLDKCKFVRTKRREE